MKWHALAPEIVVRHWESDAAQGLTRAEAGRRLQVYGPNAIDESRGPSPALLFLRQFEDFMVLILLAATAVSYFLGEVVDAAAILGVVVLNAVLGFLQEFRAERSLAALRQLAAPRCRVLRDGQLVELPAAELVPGDVLAVEAGDRVPADARLLEAFGLEVDEAALTGESVPVTKAVSPVDEAAALAERSCMLYQGTVVTRGHGRAVVVATGMNTEVGGIAGLIQTAEQVETPLQRRLEQLGRVLVGICLTVAAVVAGAGIWQGEDPYRMFLTGVSLAVAAIPEGLPAVVTVALALGVQRMIARNVIVRRLPAVEALGCATVICSDKTGTLTQNAMTVRAAYADGVHHDAANQPLPAAGAVREALVAASLCNNAPLPLPEGRGPGDPTEVALVAAAAAAGLDPAGLRRAHPRLEEVPFDSERRLMTVVCRSPSGERVAYVKGAADAVLARCRTVLRGGREVPLTAAERDAILAAQEELARRGLRVLAAAGRRLPGDGRVPAAEAESDLVFYGLLGLMDPPRPEVPAAVRTARQAGVEVVLITGDHARTAEAVASEIGILRPGDTVATGADLDAWDDAELARRVPSARVYARVTPAHKLRIVRAWRRRGAVVAMTGDGVNDAPAVREADIGVAMGLTGTDVTREAAAIVLTDDNFASIVAAVEEGRTIYANIRKFVRYLLACNAGEVLVMFLAALLGMPLPLLPVQILFVNLVTDGLPAIALGVDPPEPGVMRRPPRDPNESLFAHGLGWRILRRGAAVGLVCLAVFAVVLAVDNDLDAARTATTLALVLCQLWHAFECRQEGREPVPASAPLNRALVWAVLSSLAATLAILYVPVLQSLFRTTPLGLVDWLVAAAGTVLFGALGRFDGVWTVRAAVGSGSPLRTTGR